MKKAFLKEYFQRIKLPIQSEPTLETLSKIQTHHTQTIPFEGLSPLLGIPVKLDLDSLLQKLVRDNRGGYCFEQNILLENVLTTLGFNVRGLMGRVSTPNNTQLGRTHMLLLIHIDGQPYIVDVGFGGLVPNEPLRLETDVIQETSLGSYRIIQKSTAFLLQVKIKSRWFSLYSFDLEEYIHADYEVGNWYTSTHPHSNFVNNLMVSLNADNSRYTLNNGKLSIYHLHHPIEKRQLKTTEEVITVLTTVFQLNLSDLENIEKKIARFIVPIS